MSGRRPARAAAKKASPRFSPLNHGCLYLLLLGNDTEPSFFSDASADGKTAFLYTRERLVGQDEDGLIDLYAARVDGGLPAQHPLPEPECEGESCKRGVTPAPGESSPQTPNFIGPENPKAPKHHSCPKGKVRKNGKCRPKHQKKKHTHHHRNRHHPKHNGARR